MDGPFSQWGRVVCAKMCSHPSRCRLVFGTLCGRHNRRMGPAWAAQVKTHTPPDQQENVCLPMKGGTQKRRRKGKLVHNGRLIKKDPAMMMMTVTRDARAARMCASIMLEQVETTLWLKKSPLIHHHAVSVMTSNYLSCNHQGPSSDSGTLVFTSVAVCIMNRLSLSLYRQDPHSPSYYDYDHHFSYSPKRLDVFYLRSTKSG